ncbi:hypothetical protein [Flaviaesturariibacter amylovorans]|uniref:Lipoprotein n=1 Tax=Flaviaesturariibacter amylovorans TaxID=1084520 RepID=A0ABP8H487_9BACT
MKRIFLATLLAASLSMTACNNDGNSASDNARNDSAKTDKLDTAITTDSRRNAPGSYDVTTDTGNKTDNRGPQTGEGPLPLKPKGQ